MARGERRVGVGPTARAVVVAVVLVLAAIVLFFVLRD